jgi:hypothetical protein
VGIQPIAEGDPFGDFIEVTLRVPITYPLDGTIERQDQVYWMREEYPTVVGFVNDWHDHPGAKVTVRLRYGGKDAYEEVWGADGSGEAQAAG